MKQHHVVVAIGSNCQRAEHLTAASRKLKGIIADPHASGILPNEPVGMTGPWFANQLIEGTTHLTIEEFIAAIKQAETECGRNEEERRKKIVKIDIDILLYDNIRMHEEDWNRPYIKTLLNELSV